MRIINSKFLKVNKIWYRVITFRDDLSAQKHAERLRKRNISCAVTGPSVAVIKT